MDQQWRFAVDCVTEGRCTALADAEDLTPRMVFAALDYGLRYTHHADRLRSGYIGPRDARSVLAAWGSDEPDDPADLLHGFWQPRPCKPDGRREDWPINSGRDLCPELAIWGLILGIERGWFAYNRSGYLNWSPAGRDRYAAGSSGVVVDSITGQAAFAF